MSALEGTFTVKELVDLNVLDRPMDGNHGNYHPTADEYVTDGIPFIMASDLVNGRVDYNRCKKITKARADRLQKGFSIDGDVLLTHKATIGRTAIVSGVGKDKYIMLTPQVTYYRVKNSEVLDNRYLKYYFDSTEFQNLFLQWSGGGSTRAYLGITAQLDLPIKFPNIKKQKEIVSAIDPINQKIELNSQINETLESMAKAIFKEWFIDFGPVKAKVEGKKPFGMDDETAALFPDSFEESELGMIPKKWRISSLYDLADWQNGMAFKSNHFSERGLPIIKIAELKSGIDSTTKTSDQLHEEKFRIKDRDVLFSWSGSPDTSIDTFIWDKGDAWLNQHIFKVTPKLVNKEFIYFLLKQLKSVFVEIARNKQTTGLGHVTVADLKRLQVILPTAEILDRFQKIAQPLLEEYFSNLKEKQTLSKTRDLLLPKLISGEVTLENF